MPVRPLTTSRNGTRIHAICLNRPYSLCPPLFDGRPFVALVVNNDANISSDDQHAISLALVQSGCQYAVCAGHNCSSWDDSVDLANLEVDPELTDDKFVMTTWHSGDTVTDIVFFFLNSTNFNQHKFTDFLILFIGENEQLLSEYKRECEVT
jgi:hypothetical protein